MLEKFDQLSQLGFDTALFALRHGFAKQRGTMRIGGGRQLGHSEKFLLQLAEAVEHLPLLGGQRGDPLRPGQAHRRGLAPGRVEGSSDGHRRAGG